MPSNYPPPRTPLPPHKLAKIANAFGVSSPSPHSSIFLRSEAASPSGASSASYSTARYASASKYLLHVLPPAHLPCNREEDDDLMSEYGDEDDNESVITAQTQFRRGILVPLQSTLQAQLGAIAREYSLPSTGGMVLYLVSSPTSPANSTSPSQIPAQGTGPRITGHVWSMLWHRVLRSEREDSRSLLGAGLGLGSLVPFSRSPTVDGGNGINTPSSSRSRSPGPSNFPNTPSSPPFAAITGLPSRLQYSSTNQSAPYLPSLSPSPSPDLDYDPLTDFNLNFGQGAESFLPILAKVEFDIDKRTKAGAWYEALREQRAAKYKQHQANQPPKENGAKKKSFIMPLRRDTLSEREKSMKEEIERLRALVAGPSPAVRSKAQSNGYVPLDEGMDDGESDYHSDSDGGSDVEETEMLPTSIDTRSNPADKLFSDEAAFMDLRRAKRESNVHLNSSKAVAVGMPKLKLDGATLTEEGEEHDDEYRQRTPQDEEDVIALWESKNRPSIIASQADPTPANPIGSPPKRLTQRPPPLDLSYSMSQAGQLHTQSQTPTPLSRGSASTATTAGSARLPYLHSPDAGSDKPLTSARLPPFISESEDPAAASEMGLRLSSLEDQDTEDTWGDHASHDPSLEPRDFDSADEEEKELERKLKLDEIEKTIAQFSPRSTSFDEDEISTSSLIRRDLNHSFNPSLDASMTSLSSMTDELVLGPPRSSSILRKDRNGTIKSAMKVTPPLPSPLPPLPLSVTSGSTPALAIGLKSALKPSRTPPPPPLPAKDHLDPLNPSFAASEVTPEPSPSIRIAKDLDWPPAPSPDRKSQQPSGSPESPVYPMSPDPFRRPNWSENPPIPPEPSGSSTVKPPSRFSADSEYDQNSISRASAGGGGRQRSNSIVSVKNIRNLWRKSGTNEPGVPPTPAIPTTGPSASPTLDDEREPVPPLPSQFTAMHMKRPSAKLARPDSGADPFHFDQESRYPARMNTPSGLPLELNSVHATPSSSSSSLGNAGSVPSSSNTGSVRKSILKSWKGSSPAATSNPVQEPMDVQEKGGRKRRPSVLDMASSSAMNILKRNSRSSRSSVASANTLNGLGIPESSRSATPDHNEGHSRSQSPNELAISENRPPRRPIPPPIGLNGRRSVSSGSSHGDDGTVLGHEPLSVKTPQRANFDIPSPRIPSAPPSSWI